MHTSGYIVYLYGWNKTPYCSLIAQPFITEQLEMGDVGRDSLVSDYLWSIYCVLWCSTSVPLVQFKSSRYLILSLTLCCPRKLLFWHHVSLWGATADTDGSLNHYMHSSHAMPTRISSPSSHNPCEPTDWCVWHPKWTETARGGKTSHSEGLLVHYSVLWEVPGCCLFP